MPAQKVDKDIEYLRLAIKIAEESAEPIGCGVVIVQNDEIISQESNSQRTDNCAVYNAEIKAIMAANKKLGSRTISGGVAYCSCEPCAMCLTALSYVKISRIVFDKRMVDLFPNDPQSKLNLFRYVRGLNFVPELERKPVS